MITKLTTLFSLIAVSLGILIWQGEHLETLRKEVAETKSSLSVSKKESEAKSDNFNPPLASTISSSTLDIEVAAISGSDLLKIIEVEKENDSPFGFFLGLSRILEELENHSSEELFVLAKQLERMNAEEESKAGEIFLVLVMTLAAVEPEQTMAFLETHSEGDVDEDQQIKLMAFAEWAGSAPESARNYLEKQTWESPIMEMSQRKVLDSLAAKDFRKALTYLENSKVHPANLEVIAMQAAKNPEQREDMWRLLNEDLDQKIHAAIQSGIIGAVFMESGFPGLDEAAKGMEFANPQDRDGTLSGLFDLAVYNTPEEAMAWFQRELTPEAQGEKIPEGMRIWAMRDVAAAGNWLKEQESSPTKNTAISVYATTVAKLDPQTALDWADEITEQDFLEKTRRTVLEQWHQTEPQAATAWLELKGLDPDQWLPNN